MTADRVVHKTGLATTDLQELADYLLAHAGPAVALRFVDAAERAFEQLRTGPRIGALLGLDELPYEDVRRWHVAGFDRVLILYRETADGVEVVRVLHTARDIPTLLRATPTGTE
jgi:toxin ParE1/3/4